VSNEGLWARPITEILARRPERDDARLARASRVNTKTIRNARLGGRISLLAADRLATALGYSLAQLYGDGNGIPTDEERAAWEKRVADEKARRPSRSGARG
jgi:hypothetical protein